MSANFWVYDDEEYDDDMDDEYRPCCATEPEKQAYLEVLKIAGYVPDELKILATTILQDRHKQDLVIRHLNHDYLEILLQNNLINMQVLSVDSIFMLIDNHEEYASAVFDISRQRAKDDEKFYKILKDYKKRNIYGQPTNFAPLIIATDEELALNMKYDRLYLFKNNKAVYDAILNKEVPKSYHLSCVKCITKIAIERDELGKLINKFGSKLAINVIKEAKNRNIKMTKEQLKYIKKNIMISGLQKGLSKQTKKLIEYYEKEILD